MKLTLALAALTATIALGLPGGAQADTLPTPTKAHPVVNIDNGPIREVHALHLVYVEAITPRYAYAQYNTGAAQFVLTCGSRAGVNCIDPKRGIMHLEDGSFIYTARWVRS